MIGKEVPKGDYESEEHKRGRGRVSFGRTEVKEKEKRSTGTVS